MGVLGDVGALKEVLVKVLLEEDVGEVVRAGAVVLGDVHHAAVNDVPLKGLPGHHVIRVKRTGHPRVRIHVVMPVILIKLNRRLLTWELTRA